MNRVDSLDFGTISINSVATESVDAATEGDFDLGFVFPSWDTRCTSFTESKSLCIDSVVEITYENQGAGNRFAKNRQIVIDGLNSLASKVSKIDASLENMQLCARRMFNAIEEAANAKERPVKVFFDMSTASRYYILSTLAVALRSGLVSDFVFFYPEGEYLAAASEQSERGIFSGGKWETVAVPGLNGQFFAGKPYSLLVSIGFEGAKTLRVVNKLEPSQVSVLIPSPGFSEEYARKTIEQNQRLIDDFVRTADDTVCAEAGNLVDALRKLQAFSQGLTEQQNLVFVCCGTKPHSLALGLRAYELQTPLVYYNKPSRHIENATVATGKYWRYHIRDLSVLEV